MRTSECLNRLDMDVMGGGSHLNNFWAIWSDGSKETHVAADKRYILLAAHTFGEVNFAENLTWIDLVVPRIWAIKGFSEQ